MLRNLGLDLDLSKVGKDLKLQLALPNKTIKKNISDVTQANLEGFEINGLPKITFEIPHKIQERVGKTDEIRIVDNPDIKMIKEKMLIKATWYNKKRINWFRINSITQTDSQDFVTMRVEADALQSELRATNISTTTDPIDAVDYFTHVLSQTMWQLGTVSEKIKGTYRSFDDNKKTRYEAINNGLETFGAVADWDEENRVLNILSISDIREFRGVVLKKENYVSSLEIESNSEDIVTRLYVYGNEGKGIENVNPTGMPYIEDFSYFIYPFERDLAKNVITHSDYMSDELCHAILDLKLLQGEYNPRIKDLQTNLNNAYGDLSRNNLMLVELQGQLVTTQALLDTAKATNDSSLITQRESEVKTKETEIANKVEEINLIQASIDLWENTIVSYQELISTTSFTQALQNELSLFIYEKEFSDDRYIEEVELLEAGQEQFDKYQRPTRSFTIQLSSFVNSIESQHIGNRLQIGEEVLIKSTKLKTEYKSIVLGYNVDFKTGDYQLIISDNMDDIDSMDKLATLIYKADSSSTILNNNKYKWDNIVSMKDEVEAWRDKEIKTVENRIVAGANESVVIDNRGIQAHNPDFPDERIIIQSGVMALSRDGGKTWSTSVTPYGVMAETIIGRIVAGNNLVITNDSGSFVIDNNGLTVNMDDIRIMSGQSGTPEDMIQMWNNLLLTYDEIASDNLVNEYEKNQLEKQWVKIVNIHSSMVEQFLRGWKKLEDEGIPKPLEYNEYIQAYENLNTYLNTTKQSDGFALLDVANRTSTSSINPLTFSQKFKEYEMKKASFESVIAMEFTNSAISVLEEGISLTYTKNSEILTQLNLSEEGVRIDGKLLEINARTEFNADLVMNAGVIKDKDNGIIIDLNAGEITLNKPIRISAGSNVATKDEVVESQSDKITSSTAEFYLSTSNKILSGGSWQAIAPEWVDGKYMWQRTKLTYGNGTIKYSPSANGTCISGATGQPGSDGIAGKDGVGLRSTTIAYATSTNGTTAPTTGWSSSVPTLVKGQYLWTRTIWTYTDSTTETGYSVSYIAKDGNNGTDGIAGKDGVGISSTSITYTGSTSGTVTPTSGWVTTVPTVASESFLWTRTIWTYTDNTTETGYSVARMGSNGANGATGAPGASATSYWITASNNIIGKSQTGVINPTTITFKGFSKTGTANSVAYSGRFIIQTSTNGTAYTTRYTSSADQNTYTYTIPADTLFVKCLFYMAGGTTVLLDEQTVPIVESAEGIQVGGRNLLKNSDREVSAIGGREFVQFADLAPIFDEHGINEVYSLSVDLKSSDISKRSIIQVYMQNGSGTKYSFVHAYVSVTKEYQRFKFEGLKPSLFNTGETKAMLAFYGTYDTGNFPIIRRVKLEKGNKATDWQPAPEDARTYKAWANSSDGGEDFTRVYPNRNIFPKENVARNESMTEWGLRISDSQIDVQEGTTYTSSVYYEDVTVHQVGVRMYWMDSSGSTISESPTGNYIQVGQSGYSEITSVAPVGAVSMQVGLRYATAQTTSGTATWKNMKVEEYSSRTIYTTNPELSLSGSVPKYVGFSPIDSDVSHEYEWIMNPEYAQALADEALARKVDNDTEYENLKNIAEEVSDSFNNFVGEGGEYKTEHSKLLERTTAIETDLGEYRQQINFVDTYMSAGNEGLIMGVKDSEGNPDANAMQMLLSNKSLSFMDGGEVVAYFSGQSFHINRGAIVDSLQIGQHKISNLGNGHTVFQFIG